MPRQTTEYLALLSSPGDLEDDIDAVENAISEVNSSIQHEGFSVFPRRWKRDVHPALGIDGQSVTNIQIVDSADIIIALVYTRAGTKTARAPSGTIEEVERFIARRKNGDAVGILVAFKKGQVDPDEIDLDQLKTVREFKESIKAEGLFVVEYNDALDLGRSIRSHLPPMIRTLMSEDAAVTANPMLPSVVEKEPSAEDFWSTPDASPELDEGEGTIDVQVNFEDGMAALTEAFGDIGDASSQLTASMSSVSTALSQPGASDLPSKTKRDFINTIAAALQIYCNNLELALGKARNGARDAFSASDKLVSFYGSEIPVTDDELGEFLVAVQGAHVGTGEFMNTIKGVRETIVNTPRMTSDLNSARRRAVKMLDALIALLEKLVQKLNEITEAVGNRAGSIGMAAAAPASTDAT